LNIGLSDVSAILFVFLVSAILPRDHQSKLSVLCKVLERGFQNFFQNALTAFTLSGHDVLFLLFKASLYKS
jgi:hypothetical protein